MYKEGTYSCRGLSISVPSIPSERKIKEIEEFIKIRPETESLIRDNNTEDRISDNKTEPEPPKRKRRGSNSNSDKSK